MPRVEETDHELVDMATQTLAFDHRDTHRLTYTDIKEECMSIIEKSIEVSVPEYVAYGQWTRFAEFPRFMEGVKEVTQLGPKRLHWKAALPGQDTEWDAEIIEQTADKRLALTYGGGAIKGWVATFHELPNARSKIALQVEYAPQGVAENTEEALGLVSLRVQSDLERFKALIEKRWVKPGSDTIFDNFPM